MKNFFIVIIFISSSLVLAFAELGIDLSTLHSQDSFDCFLREKYTFLNVRAYRAYGGIDANAPQTIVNARKAGYKIENVGVYMFPCINNPQKNVQKQTSQMMQLLKGSEYSTIWVDLETNTYPTCEWSINNFTQNCNFMIDLMNAVKAQSAGKKVGIYATNYMWTTIFGSPDNCKNFSNYPLWYAHYDKNPNFSDFTPFGGWQKPQIKQYKGTTAMCSGSVDLNYRE